MTETLHSPTLRDVLYYGYDPGCSDAGLPHAVEAAARQDHLSAPYDSLVSTVQSAFQSAVDAELRTHDAERHVVPLSSGLDSRAILATLLDHPAVDRSDVQTVTFGTPGTWDFELGPQVADAAGVANRTVDLRPGSFDWSIESLRAFARTQSRPIRMFEGYVNDAASRAVDVEDAVHWIGYLGGPTTGKDISETPHDSWEAAVAEFVEHGHYTSLEPPGHEPRRAIPSEPYLPQSAMAFPNQLSFAHRQQCYIRPVVVGDGPCCTPFAHPEWLEVILNVPRRHRANRAVLTDAMVDAYPELFALPTDASAGYPLSVGESRRKIRRGGHLLLDSLAETLGRSYTHPDTNYLNFARTFREAGELRRTAEELIDDLQERELPAGVNPGAIWERHQDGSDRSRDIKVLCSLELYLSEHEEAAVGADSAPRQGRPS